MIEKDDGMICHPAGEECREEAGTIGRQQAEGRLAGQGNGLEPLLNRPREIPDVTSRRLDASTQDDQGRLRMSGETNKRLYDWIRSSQLHWDGIPDRAGDPLC